MNKRFTLWAFNMLRPAVCCVTTALLLLTRAAFPADADKADKRTKAEYDKIVVRLSTEEISLRKADSDQAVFDGGRQGRISGQPALPWQSLRIMLPPNAKTETVRVVLTNIVVEEVPGAWDVKPMGPVFKGTQVVWEAGTRIVDGRDIDKYRANAFTPESFVERVTCGRMREWRFADIEIAPYQYNPVTKQMRHLVKGDVQVTFDHDAAEKVNWTRSAAISEKIRAEMKKNARNFTEIAPAYESSGEDHEQKK